MKRYACLLGGITFGAAVPAAAQSATFASLSPITGLSVQRFDIDWPHSAVEFSVRFMGLSTVRGAFADFGGTIMYDPKNVANSSVSAVINTKSINTNVQSRDNDLRSANFFDAEKYPQILFHSDRIVRTAKGFVAHGPLTMHGVTQTVAIVFTQTHTLQSDAWGNKRIGFLGHLSVNRKDFGILGTKFWNSEFDPGRMSISDNVDIDLNVEGEINQVERWTTPKGDSLTAAAATRGWTSVLDDLRTAAADSVKTPKRFVEGVLNAASVKAMHRGKFADAVQIFGAGATILPDAGWAYAGLGEAYLMSGNRASAVESFQKALSVDSTNTVAFEYLRQLQRR